MREDPPGRNVDRGLFRSIAGCLAWNRGSVGRTNPCTAQRESLGGQRHPHQCDRGGAGGERAGALAARGFTRQRSFGPRSYEN